MKIKGKTNFTEKQKRFCDEYLKDFNGSAAYIRAGHNVTPDVAKVMASKQLTNTNVRNYLAALKAKEEKKSEITREILVAELSKIALFDIRELYDDANALIDIKDFTDASAGAVAGIDTDELFAGRKRIGYSKKVKLHNKIAAIERLSKMFGYDAPVKSAQTDKEGNDVETTLIPQKELTQIVDAINLLGGKL